MSFGFLSVALCMFGLYSLLSRRTLLGWIVGIQLLVSGLVSAAVFLGHVKGEALQSHVAAFFMIVLGGMSVVIPLALATRLFYLRKSVQLSGLKELKN